jgi:hypothetical protein
MCVIGDAERARSSRHFWLAVLLAVVGLAIVLAVELPSSGHVGSRASAPPRGQAPASIPSDSPTTVVPSPTTIAGSITAGSVPAPTTTSAGSLPQSEVFPSSSSPEFALEMSALWHGVVTGALPPASPAFFPEAAYLQLKDIGDPTYDYVNRLLHDFGLDLAAAHQFLGAGAASAHLVGVVVPVQYAHWVPPGVCENRVGYFEVPNSRVVYAAGGQVPSFGIASLISWRGVWYVVHLGAVVRPSDKGLVEDPEIGPGSSARSSTC